MHSLRIDRRVLVDLSWWHWALTVPLLTAHLLGQRWALPAAIGLCAVVTVHFWARLQAVRPLPVQVRMAYLVLLVGGLLPWMGWLHWVQLIGTTLMVTVGYCPLLRLLRLLPWNRIDPLSAALVRQVLWNDPCLGGILIGGDVARADGHGASCSLLDCSLVGFEAQPARGETSVAGVNNAGRPA